MAAADAQQGQGPGVAVRWGRGVFLVTLSLVLFLQQAALSEEVDDG